MKPYYKLSLLLTVLAGLASTAIAQSEQKGVKTSSPEGNFTVQLPTKSQQSSQNIPTDLGPIKMQIFASEENAGMTAYMVFYSDYPADAVAQTDTDTLLENAQGGAVGSVKNSKISSDKKIKLSGFPGKEVLFTGEDTSGKIDAAWRLYMVNNRLYQIGIISIDQPIDKAKRDMVFNSFKLLETPK